MAFKIENLNDDERVLVASYTFRLFADMKEFVRKGGVLDGEQLQETENTLIHEITRKWQAGSRDREQSEGEKL